MVGRQRASLAKSQCATCGEWFEDEDLKLHFRSPRGLISDREEKVVIMMPSDVLMSEEIREAVEKIVRRHVATGVFFEHFPIPSIEHYDGKIAINLDVKATVLKEKVIEADRRPQHLDIKFLRPVS